MSILTIFILALIINKIAMTVKIDNRLEGIKQDSDQVYKQSNPGDYVDASYLLINDAFEKGKRYITDPETWIPPKERDKIYEN